MQNRSKKTEGRLILAALLMVNLIAPYAATSPNQIIATKVEVFVSPNGKDTSAGAKTAPVATLTRAQALARAARGAGHGITVHLHGGTYYLPETLVFTPEDSGTSNAPVVWQAVEGETPVISGGQQLHLSWEPAPNLAGVFQARVPTGLDIDQLFVNGQRQWMARFPDRADGDDLNVFDTWKLDHHAKPDPLLDPLATNRIARWTDPAGAYLHGMHPALWGGIHWRVTGKKPDGTLAMEGGTQNNRGSAMHGLYRYIENVFEELDAPGEWFYDRNSSTLYYHPQPGVDLAKASIEIVRLRHLIELQGSPAKPVNWLRFRGLTFRHTARTFMDTKEPLLRSDWTIYRGGAVFLTGTEDCQIDDCTFDQVGGNAIFVNNYNRRTTIRGCLIAEAGANGICFVGDPAAVRNALFNYSQRLKPADLDRTPGPKSDNYPADCLVDDCLIYRSGRVEKQTAPVEIDMAQSITVRHCSIYDVPRAGINIGDGCWGGHIIEHCDIFDTVKETGDHGSFNSWGRDRYWPEVYRLNDDASWATNRDLPFLDAAKPNVLRNNRWRCDHGWDIDLDDGSSNYEIRNNLCLNGGIKNREGFHRVVENNVIVASGFHPHCWYKHSEDIFRRNIVAAPNYFPASMIPPPWGAELDFNLVCVPGQTNLEAATKLAQQSGRDAHSLMADAQFVNPAQGDFRVKEGSPALKLGFVNFPMDQFGVQQASLRAIARTPVMPVLKMPGTQSRELVLVARLFWLGAPLHALAGEEFSAFGVSKEDMGVQLVEVPVGSAAAKAGLKSNDLIQGLNGVKISNTKQLFAALNVAGEAPLRLRVIRNQAAVEMTLPATHFITTETAQQAEDFKKLVPPAALVGTVTANPVTANDPLSVLTDGKLGRSYGPVFANDICDGAYKLDLGRSREVTAATAWSFNQGGKRGRQRLTIFGSNAASDPGWKTSDPAKFTALGSLDTDSLGLAPFTAASLHAQSGQSLGTFRWMVWQVEPISPVAENTSFQELAVEVKP